MAYIKLSKKNLFNNLNIFKEHLGSVEKIGAVLKDNAYGHGIEEMAKLCNEYGIKRAIVKDCAEAKKIYDLFEEVIVLYPMGMICDAPNVSYALYSYEDIQKYPSGTKVHLKIDTGMHRNGIFKDEIKKCLHTIFEKKIVLSGVFTHYRGGDDLDSSLFVQRAAFAESKQIVREICNRQNYPTPSFHSCNSASALRINDFDEEFARIGISMYGYNELDALFGTFPFAPVMSLYAKKISSRTLEKGARVGYSGVSEVEEKCVVSTYDIGYGDGFFRLNERSGEYRTPKGYKLLPRVSMDCVSIVSSDEEVEIFNDVAPLAKLFDTITYDVLVKLNSSIPRVVVE